MFTKLPFKHALSANVPRSMRCQKTFTVDCDLAGAFAYLADFSNCRYWDPSVVSAIKTTQAVASKGSKFEVVVRFGLAEILLNYELLSIVDNTRLVFEGRATQFRVRDIISFQSLENGGCKVHYSAEVFYDNWLGLLTPFFQPLFNRSGGKAIQGLAQCLNQIGARQTAGDRVLRWRAGALVKQQINDSLPHIRLKDRLADLTVFPGLLKFTKFGYRAMKQRYDDTASDLLGDALSGKVVVITGGTSGIGRAAVLSLIRLGAQVVVVARRASSAKDLKKWLKTHTDGDCAVELADMSLLKDVEALVWRLQARYSSIDVLINNAGELLNHYEKTVEGYEKTFATLLLGPFALTEGLMPLLEAAPAARVINVSSGGMYTQPVKISDLNYERGVYDGAKAYARAKRGLVDMTQYWAQYYGDTGVVFHAMHPGWVDTPGVSRALPRFYHITKRWLRSPEQGADTVLWLAGSIQAGQSSGGFWLDRASHPTAVFPLTRSTHQKQVLLAETLRAMV